MIGNSQQIINWLFQKQDLKQEYEIKERRKKRSLDQNSYAWQLITQIADVLRKSKEDVYLQMLRRLWTKYDDTSRTRQKA